MEYLIFFLGFPSFMLVAIVSKLNLIISIRGI